MIIHTTRKLQKFFETNGITSPKFINSFASWHGNLLTINRRKALLLTHTESLYSIFIYGVTKKEMPELPGRIRERLKRQLMRDDFNIAEIEEILNYSDHFSFFKSYNKSVIGVMNNMALMINNKIMQTGKVDEYAISNMLNNTPFKANQFNLPIDTFKESAYEMATIRRAEDI